VNCWQFLDRQLGRLPGWPNERQFVTIMTGAFLFGLLRMARDNGDLWNVELFKTILTVFAVTGFVNMILGFHFAANKNDEDRVSNTGKALDAITATAKANSSYTDDAPDVLLKPGETAKAEE